MGSNTKNQEGMLPLTPAVFNILLALADGEKHGYAIMLEVERNTQGDIKMGPGTLYGAIKRMLAAGLIEEAGAEEKPKRGDRRHGEGGPVGPAKKRTRTGVKTG